MTIKLIPAGLKSRAELIKNLVSGVHYYTQSDRTLIEYWYDEHFEKLFCFRATGPGNITVQQGSFLPSIAHVSTMHIKAEWYTELDGKKEILCMVWDETSRAQRAAYVRKYHAGTERCRYEDDIGNFWQYARPITEFDYERSTTTSARPRATHM